MCRWPLWLLLLLPLLPLLLRMLLASLFLLWVVLQPLQLLLARVLRLAFVEAHIVVVLASGLSAGPPPPLSI